MNNECHYSVHHCERLSGDSQTVDISIAFKKLFVIGLLKFDLVSSLIIDPKRLRADKTKQSSSKLSVSFCFFVSVAGQNRVSSHINFFSFFKCVAISKMLRWEIAFRMFLFKTF